MVRRMVRFDVGNCALELERGDITQASTEAIANAANSMLMGGGGVDGAIHRAAGPELMGALREVKRQLPRGALPTGKAVITPGFGLRAHYVIHCVGPIYGQEGGREAALLASCYRDALNLCHRHRIASVAFPSISTGVYGYPVSEAAPVALESVRNGLMRNGGVSLCRFVLFDAATLDAYEHAARALLR